MSEVTQFTQAQIAAWDQYEYVRQSGRFNMFDRHAQQMSGLTKDEYTFCMKNYIQLQEAANEQRQ